MRLMPLSAVTLLGLFGSPAFAQIAGAISAPVSDVRYEVTIDSAAAASGKIQVVTSLSVGGPGPVVLSLPAWTPGAYELSWFSRWVSDFSPTSGDGKALTWDKVDYETWRIEPAGARTIRVTFEYQADSLDNAMSWTRPDFALFNGTNLFLYPEGRSLNYPSTLVVHTSPGWLILSGMTAGAEPGTFTAPTYHDLVDMPFFIGRFDADSEQVAGHSVRYGSYPAGAVSAGRRTAVLKWLAQEIPAEAAVFGEIPWQTYTVLQITDSLYQGASGLEHQDSHVDVVGATLLDFPFMPGLYAHEIFHSWNVKRMRPAEMVPYRYDGAQRTPWLWVSEGITDYYADLAQVRGGVTGDTGFYRMTAEKIDQVADAPPVALTDASLSTWVRPTDGTGYIYYPKGSLAGMLLDIMIRSASDNRQSLDSVMRSVYTTTYKRQRGFTGVDWWGAVTRAAGGRSFADFNRRYIDGREPFPYDSVFALAGLRVRTDSQAQPQLGVTTEVDSGHVRVVQVAPGSAAAEAGVMPGDVPVSIADIPIMNQNFAEEFSSRFGNAGARPATIPVVVRRGSQQLTLQAPLHVRYRVAHRVLADPQADSRAVAVRNGILHG
jgi:predicted metalloprotease with PDZ domain